MLVTWSRQYDAAWKNPNDRDVFQTVCLKPAENTSTPAIMLRHLEIDDFNGGTGIGVHTSQSRRGELLHGTTYYSGTIKTAQKF